MKGLPFKSSSRAARSHVILLIVAISVAVATTSLGQPLASVTNLTAPDEQEAPVFPDSKTFVSCLAVTSDAVLRSEVMPLGNAKVADIQRDWKAFIQPRASDATRFQCAKAQTLGKSAAYTDLEKRLRQVGDETGTHAVRYTGWRDYSR